MRRSWFLLLSGCLDGSASSANLDSTVDGPRILTVIAEPAEVSPGAKIRLEAIVAGEGPLTWSLCSTPRKPIDNTAVSPECARQSEQPVLGNTLEIDTQVPADACQRFGSEAPAGTTPNAADATGGYYQPVRVALGEQVAVARIRIQCQLAAAPIDIVREFNTRYARNIAPTLGELVVQGPPNRLHVSVTLSPPEPYLRYDATTGVLEDAVEQQALSWFVSAGEITPVADGAVWTDMVEGAQLWVIARDDRGGIAAKSAQLQGLSFLRRPSTTGTILPSIGAY